MVDTAPTPHARLEVTEQLELFDDVLTALDDERRAVFILAVVEQLSALEIAEALGINRNTVYSRLRLARRDIELALARRSEESR
jgi:RNA polymerase sigma-70 factor (ECF subfamily)